MNILLAAVLYLIVGSSEKTKAQLCTNTSNTSETCCTDFKLVNGVCQHCLGSWGLDCNNTCPDGYYGFGCRSKCDCKNNQICHKENGCIQNYTESVRSRSLPIFGIAVGASSFLGLLCLIITCSVLWKRKTNNTDRRTNVKTNNDMVNDDTCSSGRESIISLGSHISHVSNDNKWSPFYDEISETRSSACNLSNISESDTDSTRKYVTTSDGNCITDPSDYEPYRTCSNKKHFSPGSQSVSLYGICRESVDKYDHLSFKRACTLPQTQSPIFPVGKKESKISTKETMLTNSSDICKILDNGYAHIDHNRRDDSQPYNSLKYDRNV